MPVTFDTVSYNVFQRPAMASSRHWTTEPDGEVNIKVGQFVHVDVFAAVIGSLTLCVENVFGHSCY